METSRFRCWMFYLSVSSACKKRKRPLTNKNIQTNLPSKFKINSLKADCKLVNKRRKPAHQHRESPLKKQAQLDGISKLPFKVQFLLPNTPSPEVGGLREGNCTILVDKTLQKEGLLKLWQVESPALKAKYLQFLDLVSRCFLHSKQRVSMSKDRRKIADKPTFNLLKTSNKMLKGRRKV